MLLAVVVLVAASGTGSAPSTANSRTAATALPGPTVPASTATATTTTTPRLKHLVATATVPLVDVYEAPGQEVPVRQLAHPTQLLNAPLVFLVREGDEDDEWLNVLLPVRPNGSTGWIRQSDVSLERHDYRILVELGAHKLTLWKREEVLAQEPIGVGTVETPTPGGLYYTKGLYPDLNPDGPYGPYAYGLSGFSEVHNNFRGGDGAMAIHGTNDPSSIGTDASNGCIRMHNEAIMRLVSILPIGVPVEIRA